MPSYVVKWSHWVRLLLLACGRGVISPIKGRWMRIYSESRRGKALFVFQVLLNIPFSPLTMSLCSLLWFRHGREAQQSPAPPKMFILSSENIFKFSPLWAKGQSQFSGHRLQPHELLMLGFDSKVETQVVFKSAATKKKIKLRKEEPNVNPLFFFFIQFFVFQIQFLKWNDDNGLD